jgi:hypothetical protein
MTAEFAPFWTRSRIEVEGGLRVNGRHNQTAGFNADLEPSQLEGGERRSAQRFA